MSSNDKVFYRVVERNGEAVIVDLDGKVIDPSKAKRLAGDVISTIERPMYVYMGIRRSDGKYKIGMTGNVEKRAKQLSIEVFNTIICERFGRYAASEVEKALFGLLAVMGFEHENEWLTLTENEESFLRLFKTPGSVIENMPDLMSMAKRIWGDDASDLWSLYPQLLEEIDEVTAPKRLIIAHFLLTMYNAVDENTPLANVQSMMGWLVVNVVRLAGGAYVPQHQPPVVKLPERIPSASNPFGTPFVRPSPVVDANRADVVIGDDTNE